MFRVIELAHSRRATLIVAALVVVAAAALIWAGRRPPTQPLETINIDAQFEASDLASILDEVEAIAIVEPTGLRNEHWNNLANSRWGEPGRDSFVYADIEVNVLEVVYGDLRNPALTMRGVGGTADGVRFLFEAGGSALQPGQQYLVFLRHEDFPTKEGAEHFWSAVRLGQGIVERREGGWLEPIQQIWIADNDVAGLGKLVAQ